MLMKTEGCRRIARLGTWVVCPKLRLCAHLALIAAVLSMSSPPLRAAITEPRLALMRATAYRAASGAISLKLEGSFSFADAVQLALPVDVTVTQGQLSARLDLAGNVFTSLAGAAEQPASGPGVIGFAPREITLVLPPGFSAGQATVQLIVTYEGRPIASNRLGVAL